MPHERGTDSASRLARARSEARDFETRSGARGGSTGVMPGRPDEGRTDEPARDRPKARAAVGTGPSGRRYERHPCVPGQSSCGKEKSMKSMAPVNHEQLWTAAEVPRFLNASQTRC